MTGTVGSDTDPREVENAQRWLAAIVESSQDAIIGKTLEGTIVSWNSSAERLYNYTTEEAVGKNIAMIVPPDRKDELRDIFASLRHGRAIRHHETIRVRKDGVRVHVSVSISPIKTESGVIAGAATIARDITASKRAEEERAQLLASEQAAREYAEEALRLREEFLSIASHELKTPLTSLQLQVQVLQRFVREGSLASAVPERATTILDAVERQIKRLTKLVTDLLDVSRITAGRLDMERQEMDLVELVQEVVARFEPEISVTGSSIELRADTPVVGYWDRMRIDQVVTNLLSNAIKYGQGGPIEVEMQEIGPMARLSIADHGIGIAPDQLPRIFNRFERLGSSQNYGGLGLGLHIVRQIVESHCGTIEVESEPNGGSTFTVDLPMKPAPCDAVTAREEQT